MIELDVSLTGEKSDKASHTAPLLWHSWKEQTAWSAHLDHLGGIVMWYMLLVLLHVYIVCGSIQWNEDVNWSCFCIVIVTNKSKSEWYAQHTIYCASCLPAALCHVFHQWAWHQNCIRNLHSSEIYLATLDVHMHLSIIMQI